MRVEIVMFKILDLKLNGIEYEFYVDFYSESCRLYTIVIIWNKKNS